MRSIASGQLKESCEPSCLPWVVRSGDLGHLDVIERTARLFDEVVVAVGNNVAKNALFSPCRAIDMLAEAPSPWNNVTVALFDGLLVDFCTISHRRHRQRSAIRL